MKEEGDSVPRNAETTHKIMSAIKSKDTEPELLVRKALWKDGYRYRINVRKLPGKPDIVLTKDKIAVFCDGDFWHGHNWAVRGLPSLEEELKKYSEFWKSKILGNIARDERNTLQLKEMGWTVIRLWESDIRKDTDACVALIEQAYHDSSRTRN